MIIQDKWGNVFYVDEEEAALASDIGALGAVDEEPMDFVGFENLFHSLPQDQLEVMICLFLGMKPVEIVKELRFKNIARFYNISSRLRKSYREQKHLFMA